MKTKEQYDLIVVGFVGHIPITELATFKHNIETYPNFKTVFFKTSSDKLWIKEGDQP